jgi:L-threonine kinase
LIGKARCPASCGEIVQGSIDGRDFLVTCPVSLYTEITVELIPEKRIRSLFDDLNKYSFKSYLAAQKTLQFFGAVEYKPIITINSRIPRGIGLSSSTADITAACMATASALGKDISPDSIADIALSIEPSDGIMFKGAMIFDHIKGIWRESLGDLPEMDVYIIDTGETVDTGEFNSRFDLKELNLKKEPLVRQALEIVRTAVKDGDMKLLGEAMIKSALAHQEILYKPHLIDVIEAALKFNAIGVNVAHSGSAISMFFERNCCINGDLWTELDGILKKHGKKLRVIKVSIDNTGPRQI